MTGVQPAGSGSCPVGVGMAGSGSCPVGGASRVWVSSDFEACTGVRGLDSGSHGVPHSLTGGRRESDTRTQDPHSTAPAPRTHTAGRQEPHPSQNLPLVSCYQQPDSQESHSPAPRTHTAGWREPHPSRNSLLMCINFVHRPLVY